ncbi:uncharacterized protein LOC120710464 [Panicum virgatum]|uniref:uncharacterized protein LOC120710464 n=1 Tax=Panicum virgatum TaxID=38727 RepID=UPI0019D5741C|nr:uncharacterized protein LOC120710464 [Panicum virgatum]
MATTTPAELRMKLLIDAKSRRVLFAEAGKDAVDFLFSLLALPLATAAALVGPGSVAGSVGTLYASVERLDDSYILPGADRSRLLRPTIVASPAMTVTSSLLLPSQGGWVKSFFKCENSGRYGYGYSGDTCSRYVTDAGGAACPSCHRPMTAPLEYVSPSASAAGSGGFGQWVAPPNASTGGAARGFVQGVVTYTVLDDLTVTPMSAISSITLLNAFAVTDLAALQEVTVRLGYTEVIHPHIAFNLFDRSCSLSCVSNSALQSVSIVRH